MLLQSSEGTGKLSRQGTEFCDLAESTGLNQPSIHGIKLPGMISEKLHCGIRSRSILWPCAEIIDLTAARLTCVGGITLADARPAAHNDSLGRKWRSSRKMCLQKK